MNREQRANLAIGILLILLGGWFLAGQFFPAVKDLINIESAWPLIVIGVGVFLLVLGLLIRVPGIGCSGLHRWGDWWHPVLAVPYPELGILVLCLGFDSRVCGSGSNSCQIIRG